MSLTARLLALTQTIMMSSVINCPMMILFLSYILRLTFFRSTTVEPLENVRMLDYNDVLS